MRLENKVALFIGGTSDMAIATTLKFIGEGAIVILSDHGINSFVNANGKFITNKFGIRKYLADVRDYQQIEEVVNKTLLEFGRIDILVDFAGIQIHKPIDEMTIEEWQQVIDVDLTGVFNSCKAVIPSMKEHKYGRIVNISSIGGRTGRPGVGVNYAAAKAGVIGLTQALARELAPWSITVNAIAPGPLKGRMFFSMKSDIVDMLQKNIPLGRVGDMDEVAWAIVYLASDEAAWTTGEVLDVNGGALI